MGTSYDTDIVAWANEQARLLRAGRLDAIDTLHIAEEIEDVGKSQQQELINRLSVLVAHLLKWKFQHAARSAGWKGTIREQRKRTLRRLRRTRASSTSCQTPTPWLISGARRAKLQCGTLGYWSFQRTGSGPSNRC
jgi:hypothetical protein